MCRGISITNKAKKTLTKNGEIPLSLFEYPTTAGISLVLPDNIYVNAQFSGKFINSDIVLHYKSNYFLKYNNKKINIKILPLPDYFNKKNSSGILYSKLIMSHTDRMRINPIRGCHFSCKYCDFNKEKYDKISFEEFKDAIEVALADKNLSPKHLLISGGVPKPIDEKFIDSIYEKITKYLKRKNIPVDIMLTPNRKNGYLSKLKSWGVSTLSINIEIFNNEIARKLNPQKANLTKELYFSFIKEAVKLFGNGKIRSILIVGLEPIDDTLKGVEELAKLGSDIVLSPFVPAENTKLSKFNPPSENDLIEIYKKSKQIADANNVKIAPRCIPCQHNALAFPENTKDYYFN
jgi:molybdenum cofactor biosynthesis enzyme MoaA